MSFPQKDANEVTTFWTCSASSLVGTRMRPVVAFSDGLACTTVRSHDITVYKNSENYEPTSSEVSSAI